HEAPKLRGYRGPQARSRGREARRGFEVQPWRLDRRHGGRREERGSQENGRDQMTLHEEILPLSFESAWGGCILFPPVYTSPSFARGLSAIRRSPTTCIVLR